jgi:uncharacterized membrane protein YoaK (UPF0700 family)
MLKADKRLVVFVIYLATLAGYVDALGFLSIPGFFVSFMSGNSTRLGVSLIAGNFLDIGIAAAIILLFVAGVIIGSLIGHHAKPARMKAILGFTSCTLVLAAAASEKGNPHLIIASMVVAMGAMNTLFERNGEVSISVTYMTGTLVKMGQNMARALCGGPKYAWVRYMLLWLGLVIGAGLGTVTHMWIGLTGLWFAAAASCGAMITAHFIDCNTLP